MISPLIYILRLTVLKLQLQLILSTYLPVATAFCIEETMCLTSSWAVLFQHNAEPEAVDLLMEVWNAEDEKIL